MKNNLSINWNSKCLQYIRDDTAVYSQKIRPVVNQSEPVVISFGLGVIQVNSKAFWLFFVPSFLRNSRTRSVYGNVWNFQIWLERWVFDMATGYEQRNQASFNTFSRYLEARYGHLQQCCSSPGYGRLPAECSRLLWWYRERAQTKTRFILLIYL